MGAWGLGAIVGLELLCGTLNISNYKPGIIVHSSLMSYGEWYINEYLRANANNRGRQVCACARDILGLEWLLW